MASYTATTSGGWSVTATWGGSGPPVAGDSVTINKGVTVTLDTDITGAGIAAITIGANAGSYSGYGVLDLSTHTLTLGGNLVVGNGAAADGELIFNAGSTLALGSNNLVLNNCSLRSGSSSSSWATVTGTGSVTLGSAYAQPKQDIVLTYVSFQSTGTITFFDAGTSGSGETNQINIQHCAFVNSNTLTFGAAGITPLSSPLIINNNDFRDIGGTGILLTGATGTATGANTFNYNTCYEDTTTNDIRINSRSGVSVVGNVFVNQVWGQTNLATAGNVTFQNNFWTRLAGDANGSKVATLNGAVTADNFTYNYIYGAWANPHYVSPSGTGGGGTQQFTYNVIEEVYSADGSNVYLPGTQNCNITNNILMGAGVIGYCTGAVSMGTVNVTNNTAYITNNSGDQYGHIWETETGASYTGTVNVYSNLMQYKSGVTPLAVSSAFCADLTSALTISIGDYNSYPSSILSYDYRNFSIVIGGGGSTTPSTHDIQQSGSFVDSTRNLATWDQYRGSTTGTVASAETYLLTLNGYSPTTKTQSAATPTHSVADLITWVQAGFVPKNQALKSSGYSGSYIGAFTPQAAKSSTARRLLLLLKHR